ncbi:MAG TPA: universal stress protein [Candidatus Dormibacteraeota bacterium]|jgi:nucleotide-binding universal stress UspA family protein|nr:universal stress protein [Candidatus Dormibacteraeota bacterium]
MKDKKGRPFRIMIAAGGRKIDEAAVRLACRVARQRAADEAGGPAMIYAVHVIEVNRSLPLSAPVEGEVEHGDEVLDRVEQVASEFDVDVETEMVQARDTGPAIVGEAEEWGADVLIMGLPYKRRFGDFYMGKTVPYVLKQASCRVILMRERLDS